MMSGVPELLPFAARVLQRCAWAASSRASINSEARSYFTYCELASINPFPIDGYNLTLYATWLALSGRLKSADSIAQYISAVSVLHSERGLPCVTPTQFGPLAQVIRGFRRMAQRPVKRSHPITPPILFNLLAATPLHHPGLRVSSILTIFHAFGLLLFLSMLRSANMVPKTRSNIDWDAILQWRNVRTITGGVLLVIHKSKTNQFAGQPHEIPLAASPDLRFCPVTALRRLMRIYGPENCGPDSPVFRIPTSSGTWLPMIKNDYIAYFKTRISGMGLNPGDYSLHGFRAGSIQQMLLVEGNLALCKIQSGHSSDAILAYSTVPATSRLDISARVNRRLASNFPPIA